jgi:tripartite-type tricarboxylate transporter receptor subunit TctC
MELFAAMAGVQLHHVPYRGDADALIDLTASRVQAYMSAIAPTLQHIRAGTLRALAVTSATRVAAAPDVPTIAETGLPGYDMAAWWGLVAPAGTPPAILQRAEAAAAQTIRSAAYRERFQAMGFTPGNAFGAEFARMIAADRERFAEIVRRAGIQPE